MCVADLGDVLQQLEFDEPFRARDWEAGTVVKCRVAATRECEYLIGCDDQAR